MDLQFLPHIVVTNPYIKRVYNAYHHAFNTLREMPEVGRPRHAQYASAPVSGPAASQ